MIFYVDIGVKDIVNWQLSPVMEGLGWYGHWHQHYVSRSPIISRSPACIRRQGLRPGFSALGRADTYFLLLPNIYHMY